MYKRALLSATLLLALSASPAALRTASSDAVKTASAETIAKLSPDLRKAARRGETEPILVTVLVEKGTTLKPGLMDNAARSRVVGNFQWFTGYARPSSLPKLAATDGVLSIASIETFQPDPFPGEDELRPHSARITAREFRALVRQGGKQTVAERVRQMNQTRRRSHQTQPPRPRQAETTDLEPETVKVKDVHNVPAAWAKGYTGDGVVAAMIDTGVDFGHPDLQGTQARVAGGKYVGWPFSYDVLSGANYVIDPTATVGPDTYWDVWTLTYYCHTLPVPAPTCAGNSCSGDLKIDFGDEVGWGWAPVELPFTWPDTSISGNYRYTVHPDYNLYLAGSDPFLALGYAYEPHWAPAAVLVVDEHVAGVYDTVYVDMDFDQDFADEKPMRWGTELSGTDLYDATGFPSPDGIWDLSGGMLTWISDGANPPPGLDVLYPGQANIPGAGELIAFVGDLDGHGTNGAGDIAAQGVITDPDWWGPVNPAFAGAANFGGTGDPVLAGMAPDAKIASFQNGFSLPLDAWTLAALGFDGLPQSGDEAHIVNNSWGSSDVIPDGWDAFSRFVHDLNRVEAPGTLFVASTGNGGHGYGTTSRPNAGTILGVGASTLYGSTIDFEYITADQLTWGDIMPWSNRGPTATGELAPHVVAVGAWATGANPLNLFPYYGNGQAAYDLFGGTSMASPVTCGLLALMYEAFQSANGRPPTWSEAKSLAMNSAVDLGYEMLAQGAGNVDADRGTDLAAGNDWRVQPPEWIAGDYRGKTYPSFPSLMHPGDSSAQFFAVLNPTATPATIQVRAVELAVVQVTTMTVTLPAADETSFTLPTTLHDLTADIVAVDPDLVRIQATYPFNKFDVGNDGSYDNRIRLLAYDWTDKNSDGNLWTDANGNSLVEWDEIDADYATGEYEYNRFSYGYPSGNHVEVSVGRDALSRRHDGVFFGVQRRGEAQGAVTIEINVLFYKKRPWTWLTLDALSVVAPAGGTGPLRATLAIPGDAKPGTYEGAIELTEGARKTIIPVLANVAADSEEFTFGADSLADRMPDRPLENGLLNGGFSWAWRYESGDWRLFHYDLPDGTPAIGRSLVVDTQWKNTPTDVDTWVYGPKPDAYSGVAPDFFGPTGNALAAGSEDTHVGSGQFRFRTRTGGPRELVAAPVRPGLHTILLHNVLYAGAQLHEPLVGRVFPVEVDPVAIDDLGAAGSWTQSFLSGEAFADPLTARGYGLIQPERLDNQSVGQDDVNEYRTAGWTRTLTLQDCGLLSIVTRSNEDIDIDLYLLRDGGNGVIDPDTTGDDQLIASSLSFEAAEEIEVEMPQDGTYFVLVHGFTVLDPPGVFSIIIREVEGTDLTVSGLPAGPISADTPLTFDVNWSGITDPFVEGVVYVGPQSAPTLIRIPVHIVNRPKSSAEHWPLYR